MRWMLVIILALWITPSWACGVKSDCKLGDRIYRIYVPDHKEEKIGAIFFAHGWRNSAAGTMSNKSLLELADELNVALVAPQSIGDDWKLPNRPRERENTGEVEYQYYRKLIDEVEKRYSVDRDKILMTGFSAGGMMTWSLACAEGGLFAGFAPMSGTFWGPVPKSCPSKPVNLMHFHATDDNMVPLEGRRIADTKQGNVYNALSLFTKTGNFGPEKSEPAQALDCKRRTNPQGKILEFCTHQGGHSYAAAYVRRAWKAFGIDAL